MTMSMKWWKDWRIRFHKCSKSGWKGSRFFFFSFFSKDDIIISIRFYFEKVKQRGRRTVRNHIFAEERIKGREYVAKAILLPDCGGIRKGFIHFCDRQFGSVYCYALCSDCIFGYSVQETLLSYLITKGKYLAGLYILSTAFGCDRVDRAVYRI